MNQPRRALAATAVVAFALTGCAQSPSDAAVVDGVALPVTEVQAAAVAVAPIAQKDASVIETSIVNAEVQGLVAEKIGANHKVALTDATRASVVAGSETLKALMAAPGGRALAIRLADTTVVSDKVGADTFAKECSAMAVNLNPRYGVWAKELCGLESGSGSLSKPAPTAAATAG